MKTKTVKKIDWPTILFAFVMLVSLIVTSAHLKDVIAPVAAMNPAIIKAKAYSDDTGAKIADDTANKLTPHLHPHTDKTMLKDVIKNVNDSSSKPVKRNEEVSYSSDNSVGKRSIELLLVLHMTYAALIRATSQELVAH